MSTFIQLHLLTSYPPSNLNRDDLGRPKTAIMGGIQRIRISSQSLKRAWRTSDIFDLSLSDNRGVRTKRMGNEIHEKLVAAGVPSAQAKEWAKSIAGQFGKLKKEAKDKPEQELEIEQLMHFNTLELQGIDALRDRLAQEKRPPTEEELKGLHRKGASADIAMFGRMLADYPQSNVEAAVQVAHAITVHKAAVEDDYFTAVDDLNKGLEDVGAGHLGETEFAAGLYYLYLCINCSLLMDNLNNNQELCTASLRSLAEAAATISPSGKQNSFASRSYASYIIAEKGSRQPRTLSAAYLKPVVGADMLGESIDRLIDLRHNMDEVYGPIASEFYELDVTKGKGKLDGLLEFVADCCIPERKDTNKS